MSLNNVLPAYLAQVVVEANEARLSGAFEHEVQSGWYRAWPQEVLSTLVYLRTIPIKNDKRNLRYRNVY